MPPNQISPNMDVRVACTSCLSFLRIPPRFHAAADQTAVWIFAPKMDVLGPNFFCGGGIFFMGVLPLMNNTTKPSAGEDLVQICPAVAEQLHQKKKNKNTERPLKH